MITMTTVCYKNTKSMMMAVCYKSGNDNKFDNNEDKVCLSKKMRLVN